MNSKHRLGCGLVHASQTDRRLSTVNISQVCDNSLSEVVRRAQEQKWRQDHAEFIAAYNATVEKEGLPLDEWRRF